MELKEIGVDLNEFLKDGKGDRGSLGDVIGKMGKGGDAIIKRIELGLAGGGDGDGGDGTSEPSRNEQPQEAPMEVPTSAVVE